MIPRQRREEVDRMRKNGLLGMCLLLGVAIAAAARGAETGAAAVDARWAAAIKANDLEAVMACYAPDAVMWLPGAAEARGEKAIREFYQGLLSGNTVKDVAFSNTQYDTARDLATGCGDVTVTFTSKSGGPPAVMKARFTVIAKRRDGQWVYVTDHASSAPEKP
jgi:uncharacterized protein (TIGR02246 family)